MVIKVNNSDLRVLILFIKCYDKEHYIQEVKTILSVSSRTALVIFGKLEKKGILEPKTKVRIKAYSIKNSTLSRDFFLLTEQYKKIQFLEENHLIKEVFEKADDDMGSIILMKDAEGFVRRMIKWIKFRNKICSLK